MGDDDGTPLVAQDRDHVVADTRREVLRDEQHLMFAISNEVANRYINVLVENERDGTREHVGQPTRR